MTETTETITRAEIVDLFLEKHGSALPGHIVDFALDVRMVIAELEDELARQPAGIG